MRLFARRGYDGVGVAELSEALGVNPPSLYAAYGSKCGLFEHAMRIYRARFEAAVPEALESEERLDAAVARLFAMAADAYTQDTEAAGCMVIEGGRSVQDPGARALLEKAHLATRRLIVERFERGNAPEPDLLADYVLAILSGLSASARRGAGRERLQAMASIAAAGFATRVGVASSAEP